MRAPLLRLAIGLPIALLVSVAFVVYFLVQSAHRPAPRETRASRIARHGTARLTPGDFLPRNAASTATRSDMSSRHRAAGVAHGSLA